ncbi:cbb3-type cytochrome c oxidase subunit I [Streptosporangium vulgare]|uniref:cbb3-type cytochrome c oxidase subunit I n=1 Tax=Streptosporangium vulgare TaxID=46190 RepID=UPI0031D15EC8
MTALNEPLVLSPVPTRKGSIITKWASSTDHKVIGHLYLITSFIFFLIGGVMALIMRAELAQPALQFVSNEQFNQLFTMHGTHHAADVRDARCSRASPTSSCRCRSGAPDVAFPATATW